MRYLEEAVLAAHRELHRYRAEHTLPEAPRTTLVACIVQQGVAIWAHVGDSRLYLIRGGRIVERTIDHSRVHHLVQAGLIRPEDAKDHPGAQPHLQLHRRLRRADGRGQPVRSRCATATRCCCAPTACGDR